MMRARLAILGVLSLVCAGLIVLELILGGGTVTEARLPPPAVPAAAVGDDAADERTPDWIAAALARPLFTQSRRPPAAAATLASPAGGPPRLTGVVIGPAGGRAIFAATDNGKALVVAEGDAVGGYVVRRIDQGQVFLDGPRGAQTLRPIFADQVSETIASPGLPPVPAPPAVLFFGAEPAGRRR